jgi:hypothetical protein|tara:strand:- start:2098 stop:2526 length:429 start_codon:yes stop_codon:yes gene_type:complete
MVILNKILPLVAIGAAVLFLGNVIARPAQAKQSAEALTSAGVGVGSSLSSIGTGIGNLFSGFKQFDIPNAFFSLKNLIYEEDTNSSNTLESLPNPNTPSVAGSYSAAAGPASQGTSSTWSAGPNPSVSVGGASFSPGAGWSS